MTIVFFFPVILRDAHRRIYGMDELEQDGHKIIILDATKHFKIYHPTVLDPFILKRTIICENINDFRNFRDDLIDDITIFITDYLYMKMAYSVLNILIIKQDILLAASARFTPGHHNIPKGAKGVLYKLVRFADNYFPLHIGKLYYKFQNFYVPDYFLGATKFLTPTNTILSVRKKNRIYVHSDDINRDVALQNRILNPQNNVGVFLDQMLPYFNGRNPDLDNTNINKKYKIDYYTNLVRTLENLKEELGLDEIVIALHPEAVSIRTEIDNKFWPFRTFIGVSNELIKESSVVFGHYSTAIGMAVFYKKPIILFVDSHIREYPNRLKFINLYKIALGLSQVLMDENNNDISRISMEVNEELYDLYSKKFLKEISYEGNSYNYAVNKILADIESS